MLTSRTFVRGELDRSHTTSFADQARRALAMHVFCASITLVMEASGTDQPTHEILDCIKSGLNFLDQVQSDNMVAKEGLKIVERLAQQYDIFTPSNHVP